MSRVRMVFGLSGLVSGVLYRRLYATARLATTHAHCRLAHTADAYVGLKPAGYAAPSSRNVLQVARLLHDDRLMEVSWEDGETTRYPYVWLRDNCQCETCFHSFTKARLTLMHDLDVNVKATQVKVQEDSNQLVVMWHDGHVSSLDAHWLRERSFKRDQHDDHDLTFRCKAKLWRADMKDRLPTYQFAELLSSDWCLYEMLTSLEEYGVSMIHTAPQVKGQVQRIAERIAFVRRTAYGSTYEVKAREDPPNLAWTNNTLGLHVDFTYFNQSPGLQMLHCLVQADSKGGETQLVDGFEAARQMEEEYPFYYKLLCQVPLDFLDIGSDHLSYSYLSRHFTFTYNCDGNLEAIRFNNHTRDSFMRVPLEVVAPLYKALQIFNTILYRSQNIISFRLQPGQIVFFDNDRVMHGRAGFTLKAGSPARNLQGCYIDWDEIHSRRRYLKHKLAIDKHKTDHR